jgi:hypothetical protein
MCDQSSLLLCPCFDFKFHLNLSYNTNLIRFYPYLQLGLGLGQGSHKVYCAYDLDTVDMNNTKDMRSSLDRPVQPKSIPFACYDIVYNLSIS